MNYPKARNIVRKVLRAKGMNRSACDDHFVDSCAGDLIMTPEANVTYIIANNIRFDEKRKWSGIGKTQYWNSTEKTMAHNQFYFDHKYNYDDFIEFKMDVSDFERVMNKLCDKKYRRHKKLMRMVVHRSMDMTEAGRRMGISVSRVSKMFSAIIPQILSISSYIKSESKAQCD